MARGLNLTMSQWDDLTDDDRDWQMALAATDARREATRCPVCGSEDPEKLCQNPAYQHAWEVTTTRCYKQRAVLMTMEKFKNDPYASTIVPHVSLNEAKKK